jgi:HlyD family secretion protein
MLKQLAELYRLLTREQRKKLLRLQVLVVLMAFAEIAGVVSIGPFMALVGDMSQLQGEGRFAQFYQATGATSPEQFLFWVGIGVLVLLTLAAAISAITVWRLSMYGARVGAELSIRLYRHYMHQPWLFHAGGSSSELTKQITGECQRVTGGIINPLMQMNAKIVMAVLMAVGIFIYNPAVALIGVAVFTTSYWLLFRIVRTRLMRNGQIISRTQQQRFKLMAEGFGGIKDTLLLGRQPDFVHRFDTASSRFAHAQGTNQAMSQVPRFAMELVAFGSIIFLILYLLATHEGNLGTILPVLSVYALAGFKLLPAFQQVYTSLSSIKGNLAALDSIRDDLRASSLDDSKALGNSKQQSNQHLVPNQSMTLQDATFYYPGKSQPALCNLTITIPVNKVIGLVGASGSGKSTAIDLLLGLIQPQIGTLLVDGQPLNQDQLRAWQNTLGFVAQSIFLADSSIRENIAFGLPAGDIEEAKVKQAATMAHLNELIEELPNGLDTRVGERGVQLSGGQRQRIGIARALYHDAEVLILDEATSALDGITEKLIMDAIHDFAGKKTIIMIAHRLATVKQCDQIYLMAAGKVVDSGTYGELSDRNTTFKRMAEHA